MVMENTVPATPIVEEATAPSRGARAGAAAVVKPGAVDQPLRDDAAAVDGDKAQRQQDTREDHTIQAESRTRRLRTLSSLRRRAVTKADWNSAGGGAGGFDADRAKQRSEERCSSFYLLMTLFPSIRSVGIRLYCSLVPMRLSDGAVTLERSRVARLCLRRWLIRSLPHPDAAESIRRAMTPHIPPTAYRRLRRKYLPAQDYSAEHNLKKRELTPFLT